MSNYNQFVGGGFPIGGVIQNMPWTGDKIVMADGSEWLSDKPTAPFAYSAAYAGVPEPMKTPHGYLNGPYAGGMHISTGNGATVAFDGTSTWVTGGNALSLEGDSTNGYKYWRSTDGGANWTQLTLPNLKPYSIYYVGGKFVGYAVTSATNGCITSSDGLTWTTIATTISVTGVMDIVSGGGTQLLVLPTGGTAGAYSTDGGTTWTASTLALSTPSGSRSHGYATWNAGAGLYIAASNVAGQYQTSPTGATWTSRAAQSTFLGQTELALALFKFASNATTTIVVGANGFVLTTTDGLTWGSMNWVTGNATGLPDAAPSSVFYDGTRFVVCFGDRVFYSTNGTSWTEGKRFPPGGSSSSDIVTSGVLLRMFLSSPRVPVKMPMMTNATLTTYAFVTPMAFSSFGPAGSTTYYRIK